MTIVFLPPSTSGGGASSDTLDDVTGRGATTANAVQVGGLNVAGAYALPTSDGSANQVLQTDGAGALSFTTISVTGGLTYKGTFNVTTASPSLANALKGDFYIIQGVATLYGQNWTDGDHLVINEDMGGSISNGKIDKIDNTDLVSSVNGLTGPVVLNGANVDGDHTASNYSTANDKIESHLAGIDTVLGTLGTMSTQASNSVSITGGSVSGITDLAITDGGTGASNASDARTNLGVAIGSDVQAYDAQLADVAGLTPTNNHVIVGNGANFTAAQLDLNKLSDVSYSAGAGIDNYVLTYDHSSTSWGAEAVGASSDTLDAVTGRGATTSNAVQVGGLNVAGAYALPTSDGSANQVLQTDGAGAVSFASLGTMSTQAANSVSITGGSVSGITDIAIADGGTGASNASDARTNLGLGTMSTQASNSVSITGGSVSGITDITIADGGTGASNASDARTNLGVAIGSDVQAYDAQLDDVAGLTPTNNHVIIGNGANFTAAQLDLNKLSDVSYSAGAGIDNYVLTYDHSSTSWGAEVAASGLAEVVDDSSPELGGDLDVLTRSIVSSSNRAITLAPNGSGLVTIAGNATSGAGQIQLNCEQNSHGIKIKGPAHSAAASYTLTLPDDTGTNGQFLRTDGAGALSWGTASGGAAGWTYSAKTASDSPVTAAVDYHYSVTGTTTITLPAAAAANSGKEIRIKVLGSDTVTIGRTGSDTIDGVASDYSLNVQYSSITVVSNGANGWEII